VQWAKVVHELGLFGLIPFIIMVGGLTWHAVGGTVRMRNYDLRRAHGAFGAFLLIIFIYFFKAWVIDVDPGNVFFWIFVGLLYRLAALDRATAPAPALARTARLRTTRGRARLAPQLGPQRPRIG
jgi:hypothetical protein